MHEISPRGDKHTRRQGQEDQEDCGGATSGQSPAASLAGAFNWSGVDLLSFVGAPPPPPRSVPHLLPSRERHRRSPGCGDWWPAKPALRQPCARRATRLRRPRPERRQARFHASLLSSRPLEKDEAGDGVLWSLGTASHHLRVSLASRAAEGSIRHEVRPGGGLARGGMCLLRVRLRRYGPSA